MAIRALASRIAIALVVDSLLTALCYGLQLNLATASLILLLSVVLQALSATFVSAVAVSLLAAVFLNYFFVAPVFSWRIDDPFDVIALTVFVVTSLVITGLAARASAEAQKADRRRQSLEQIYQCSQRLLTLEPDKRLVSGILKIYREVLHLGAACFFDGAAAEAFVEGSPEPLVSRTREAYLRGSDHDDAIRQITIRCIRSHGRTTAAIGLEGLQDPELIAGSLVTMAITALERASVFHSAGIAAAEAKTEAFRAVVLDALAHEIKTPLATILTAAGALHETVTTVAHLNLAAAIEEGAARMSELTSSLLRKAERQSEPLQTHVAPADLVCIVERLAARQLRQQGDRRIDLEVSGAAGVRVPVDAELISLAIGQLLDNAVRYSSPTAAIRIHVLHGENTLTVKVWNAGKALHPTEREKIFDRFYRGAATKHKIAGSGLGLYLARRIARAHDGTLDLDDTSTTGVGFRLTLPVRDPYDREENVTNEVARS